MILQTDRSFFVHYPLLQYFCHIVLKISVQPLILLSKKRHCKSEVQGPRRSETLSQNTTGALVRDQTHYQANVLLFCDQQWFFLFLQNNNHVDDLFTDLCDGRLLICLLETISGDKLGKIGMNLSDNKILCTLQMRVC